MRVINNRHKDQQADRYDCEAKGVTVSHAQSDTADSSIVPKRPLGEQKIVSGRNQAFKLTEGFKRNRDFATVRCYSSTYLPKDDCHHSPVRNISPKNSDETRREQQYCVDGERRPNNLVLRLGC